MWKLCGRMIEVNNLQVFVRNCAPAKNTFLHFFLSNASYLPFMLWTFIFPYLFIWMMAARRYLTLVMLFSLDLNWWRWSKVNWPFQRSNISWERRKSVPSFIFFPRCQDEVRQAMVEWILTCYYIEILLIHSNGSISNGSSSIYWPLTPTSFC